VTTVAACILRAEGARFDAPAFLADSPLEARGQYRAGEPLAADNPGGPVRRTSGFDLAVSRASSADLELQIHDAIEFLDVNEEELRRLGSFEGVDAVTMEFSIPWGDAAAQTLLFPSDLLWRAGALDISLQVTHYLVTRQ
jgi:hypothetical protein